MAVHFGQVLHLVLRAEAVFHPVITMEVGSGFDAADDKESRDAVARVRHGDVFDYFRTHVLQPARGIVHSSRDFW